MNRGVLVSSAVFMLVLGSILVGVYAIDCNGNPRCIIRQAAAERNPDVCNQMNESALIEGCMGYVEEVKASSPQAPATLWIWTAAAVVAIILVVAVVVTMKRRNRF